MLSKLEKPEFSHQHRLGLVVYGGVSLAIYMNGICQEFYNAVRGRGIYKLIKALTDADIVVDIISGTSAGGINGVLLSYALANSQGQKTDSTQKDENIRSEIKFEEFASVWKESGDIKKLLFDKTYDGHDKSSFLDGDGYYRSKIKKALEDRYKEKKPAPGDDWFSEFEELDLFVTGTDLLGKIYRVFDNTGCVIEVKDHQTIFHLKYRQYGDNPFKIEENNEKSNKITYEALAKLCQITSSFPVAFPTVAVSLDTPGNADEKLADKKLADKKLADEKEADKKLVKWGNLKKHRSLPNHSNPGVDTSRSSNKQVSSWTEKILTHLFGLLVKNRNDDDGKGDSLYFVDGGVLDNRPFSYTIEEIYQRRAERPVFRKLFYIDPSPDRFYDNPRYKKMLKPDIVQVALDSLTGIPRYESINNDLELIKAHNQKIRRYKFLVADIEEQLEKEVPDLENRDIYDQQRNIYLRTRLISLKDNVLPLIFLESNDDLAVDEAKQKKSTLDQVADILANQLTAPNKTDQRLNFLKDLEGKIEFLDIEYALRRYYFISDYVYKLLHKNYLINWLYEKKIPPLPEEKIDDFINELRCLIKKLNKHVKLLQVVQIKSQKFFEDKRIEEYFYKLFNNCNEDSSGEEFAKNFYKGMLWLHARFLDVKLPSNLNTEYDEIFHKLLDTFSTDLENNYNKLLQELEEKLNEWFKKKEKDRIDDLNYFSNQSILKYLFKETRKQLGNSHFGYSDKNKLLKYFNEFEKFDAFLFPLDYLASVPEKQEIETYRISPEDAKWGLSESIKDGERLARKLAGNKLKAFGGFFKKSWRANDILWGRLDGLNRIVEALITEDKIINFLDFLERESTKHSISQDDYLECLLSDVLSIDLLTLYDDKKYLDELKVTLKNKLKELKDLNARNNTEESSKQKPSKQDFKNIAGELGKVLVNLGHLFILHQDFNKTIQAAIDELLSEEQQKKLNNNTHPTIIQRAQQFIDSMSLEQKQKLFPLNPTVIQLAHRSIDFKSLKQKQKLFPLNPTVIKFAIIQLTQQSIMKLAIIHLAQQSIDSMSLEKKKEFFCNKYEIASEGLESIPKSELKNIRRRFFRIFLDIFKLTFRSRFESMIISIFKQKPLLQCLYSRKR